MTNLKLKSPTIAVKTLSIFYASIGSYLFVSLLNFAGEPR